MFRKVKSWALNAMRFTPAVRMTLAQVIESMVQSICQMLSDEINPPIDDVIHSNLVQHLVTSLDKIEHPNLQFEAAWALAKITSGTSSQIRHVVDSGAVMPLVNILFYLIPIYIYISIYI